jgi:hypothetical protein
MKRYYKKSMAECVMVMLLVLVVCTAVYAVKPEGKAGTASVRKKAGTPSAAIEPDAMRILKEMSTFLGAKKQFTFKANVCFEEILPAGEVLLYDATIHAAVKRPARLYAEYTDDGVDKRLWYDGKKVTMVNTKKKVYTDVKVPGTIDEALDHLMATYDMSLPLAELAYSNVYDATTVDVTKGIYEGIHTIQGTKCHHLAFSQQLIDWQIWIDTGGRPVPRRIVIIYKTEPGAPRYTATLSQWDFLPKFRNRFVADIPKGTDRIDMVKKAQKK